MAQGSLAARLLRGRSFLLQVIKRNMGLAAARIPLRVEFNVTKNCNLRCKHCYAALDSVQKARDPSLKQIEDIIDDLHHYGCRWFRVLGGEPLLRDDIGDIIRYARNKNMFVEINTNGLLVHKRIRELKSADAVCISLDGDKEANDYLRGKDTYEKIISGIETAVANGIKTRLHSVLTRQTLSSLDHMAGLSKKYNINMNFGEATGGDNHWEKECGNIPEDELTAFYGRYARYKRDGVKISNSFSVIRYARDWPWKQKNTIYEDDKDLKNHEFEVIPCRLGRLSTFIDIDGGMYPCPTLWKQGINYFEHGFKKSWEHLGSLKCLSCRQMSCNELSRILSGNARSLLNGIIRFT